VSPHRWDFISENGAAFGVKRIYRALGVSRSGYYRHQATASAHAARQAEQATAVAGIRQIHADHHGAYGARGSTPDSARGAGRSTVSVSPG
jgi:hypothetical protein